MTKIVLILFNLLGTFAYCQPDEVYDIFPLRVGLQYEYEYSYSDTNCDMSGYYYHVRLESGQIDYLIIDSSLVGSWIEWKFTEHKMLVVVYEEWPSGYDTTYNINTVDTFLIKENINTAELLCCYFWPYPAVWKICYQDVPLYRYSIDSSYLYTFSNFTYYGTIDSVWFSANYGLYKRRFKYEWHQMTHIFERMAADLIGVINDLSNPILLNVDNYALSQNYPNPFNPSTTIKYQLPEISFVTLKVYDILGREVATLVNEEKPAGSYEVQFSNNSVEGQNLSSGIYFYQLKAGDYSETKKMILLR